MLTFDNTPTRTRLTYHGSFGGVVQAFSDTCDEAVSFVNFARSGTDFIIMKFGVNPCVTAKEAQLAGDLIDKVLAYEAARFGVRNLFLVHSSEVCELVRTYQTSMAQLWHCLP
jgi:hypothetical protein